ncbi:MAG TPA: GntR family transcriptional regulator [Deltaproteobacteria bacterium]|nr:GntR family transcriptional regulator [Deltaproteobacteria bacterium]HQI80772.1 GntR family transcriptional regulator [Deltaproteobacteria bacterium]
MSLVIQYPLSIDDIDDNSDKPLPRRIADLLLARIFTGELKPGDRLPPDRLLAGQLGVDRTSLRAALSELAGRNIVRAVRGSGVVVLDYREHAGLDFLDAVLGMSDIDLGGALHLEILDLWVEVVPAIIRMAMARSTPADMAALDALFGRQLDLLDKGADPADIAAVEVELQDYLVRLSGSTIVRLLANSLRRSRLQFVGSFYRTVDVKAHILAQRSLIRLIAEGGHSPEKIAGLYRSYLQEHTRSHRARIASQSPQPHRRRSPGPPGGKERS